ncbi:hypothetical protein D3C81_1581080 [compost metagenome]
MFDQPRDLVVQLFDHCGIDFHLARSMLPGLCRHAAPIRRIHAGAGGFFLAQQPHRMHALDTLAGDCLVTCVVATSGLLQIAVRCLQRPVRGGVGGECKERLVFAACSVDRLDQVIGVVHRGIEVSRKLHRLAVVQEGRRVVGEQAHFLLPIVRRTALQHHIGLFETAILRLQLRRSAKVPLAGNNGFVSSVV